MQLLKALKLVRSRNGSAANHRPVASAQLFGSRKSAGFTLVEMMIAMGIFGLISLGSYTMFDNVIRIKDKTDAQSERLSQIQRAMVILQNDFDQVVRRNTRDVFGELANAVTGADSNVTFTRTGWNVSPFSTLQRSKLQRVQYQVEDGQLLRSYWTMLDQADQSEAKTNKLLGNVESLRLRYLQRQKSQEDIWQTTWPPQALISNNPDDEVRTTVPIVIEMILEHKHFGEIRRLFLLADGSGLPELGPPINL